MSRRVQRPNAQRADLHRLARRQRGHFLLHFGRELGNVGRVRVGTDAAAGEHRWKAVHVIEMVVAEERMRDGAAVGLGGPQRRLDVPGGIDDGRLARSLGAQQVDEVVHRPELQLTDVHHQGPLLTSTTISPRCPRV